MEGRIVLRNNTTHQDAVYVILVKETGGVYTVAGQWGKWDQFIKAGKLGEKVYYSGDRMSSAQNQVHDLLSQKLNRSYYRVPQYDTSLPWEKAVPVAEIPQPEPTKPSTFAPTEQAATNQHNRQAVSPPASEITRQDIQTTRAGLLEFD